MFINKNKWEQLIVYYVLIFTPFAILIYSTKQKLINNDWFVFLLFFYVLVYRTVTDYFRLRSKNAIGKNKFWRLLLPGEK